ncbi:MAG: hypothetical protein KF852_13190 [Saprospiraceae bacterium]|nr:hypothetical protein [Saprospiraceae bacterium]
MKKDIPTSEPQHPIDVYFREQEANIPIVFNPAHWDALEAMLDEAVSEGGPLPGMHRSDGATAIVRPSNPLSWKRLLGLVLASLFLATVPAADLILQSQRTTGHNSVSVAAPAAEPAVAPSNYAHPAASQVPNTSAPLPLPSAETAFAPEKTSPVDTALAPSQIPGSLHSTRLDSLAAVEEWQAKQDSTAEQKKKKKHLFW